MAVDVLQLGRVSATEAFGVLAKPENWATLQIHQPPYTATGRSANNIDERFEDNLGQTRAASRITSYAQFAKPATKLGIETGIAALEQVGWLEEKPYGQWNEQMSGWPKFRYMLPTEQGTRVWDAAFSFRKEMTHAYALAMRATILSRLGEQAGNEFFPQLDKAQRGYTSVFDFPEHYSPAIAALMTVQSDEDVVAVLRHLAESGKNRVAVGEFEMDSEKRDVVISALRQAHLINVRGVRKSDPNLVTIASTEIGRSSINAYNRFDQAISAPQ